MTTKTFKTTIVSDGASCHIPLPFDPQEVFGKKRAAVAVTLNGYHYRSTIFSMGAGPFVPLRKSHREAAGLTGGETLSVTLALDTKTRDVVLPDDLAHALARAQGARKGWDALSYTARREQVEAIEGAKRPETRARRLEAAIARALSARDDQR